MVRPTYVGNEITETDRRWLEHLLQRVNVREYGDFIDLVMQSQFEFLAGPRPWICPAKCDDLHDVPLMDDPTDGIRTEQILESIAQGSDFLYLYLPAAVARACCQQQSLAPIPRRLRVGGDGLLAMELPPYDGNTANEIVSIYHDLGCRNATVEDVEFFAAVPLTGLFEGVQNRALFLRSGPFGRFDIPVIGPAIFVEEEEEEEDED
ncbi:RolB family protein [Bradyrhizobium algeriense]|uniref:RolB family protein n=1 Tax=Bradyrhizobium algeriense TaxID=634784 RepID=UPI000D35E797|nr:RolB family protein [Bradyrhizobium algeriense]